MEIRVLYANAFVPLVDLYQLVFGIPDMCRVIVAKEQYSSRDKYAMKQKWDKFLSVNRIYLGKLSRFRKVWATNFAYCAWQFSNRFHIFKIFPAH